VSIPSLLCDTSDTFQFDPQTARTVSNVQMEIPLRSIGGTSRDYAWS
jgi:hypothetical protein